MNLIADKCIFVAAFSQIQITLKLIFICFDICYFAIFFIVQWENRQSIQFFCYYEKKWHSESLQLKKYNKMKINIFQFLKQGTSLNRKSIISNELLEKQIIYEKPQPNMDFQTCGRFKQSDSQEQLKPKTNNKELIQKYHRKINTKNAQFLKKNQIKVNGLDCPIALNNFTKIIKKYKIKKQLIQGLEYLGFHKPTAVQTQVIPCLIQKRNIIVTAPTGTGKTLAYLLPILQNLSPSKNLNAVIMAPTQQLANQIIQQLAILTQKLSSSTNTQINFRCITKLTESQQKRIQNNKQPGFNILVTTPMNFLKSFLEKNKILKTVEYIILDQCDKYFEQSFLQQIKAFLEIFANFHPIYALFSATIQHPVEQLLKNQVLHDCLRIQVGGKNKVLDKINQSIEYCTNEYGKVVFLKNLIIEGGFVPPALFFVQQKIRAKQLYYELRKILKSTVGGKQKLQILTGQKSKQERQQIIKKFDQGQYWALITTDLIARGIDFKNTNLVINYDFPNSMLTYIHRVGRTGRAERKGTAITLFTDQDKPVVRSLGNLLKVSGCPVPEWISDLPKTNKTQIKKRQKYPVKRAPVGHSSVKDKAWQKQLQKLESKWQKTKQKQEKKHKKMEAENSGQWIQVEKKTENQGWIQVGADDQVQ